ncbi:MAG: hydroxymethylbilane synthase [Bacillaceae bacterium]|nr:hydroxymethylbilane synthase [Bacillaceae bacterium]
MRKIVVGSRRSQLALTQTKWVIEQLEKQKGPFSFDIKEIVTKGDKILDVTLSKVGGKGLFVKEIEQAMFDHEIDMAVHSMKDMPAELPEGLMIASVPVREDHRDAFISKEGKSLMELPEGSVVGTSSLRRSAQILAVRPDLNIQSIRGNIDTRLRKLEEEDFDAIVLAAAGLKRMGWSDDVVTEYLEPDVCVPAVGQGALAIECRESDQELRELLQSINHKKTEAAVTAERTFLHLMEGGCQVPIAGYAFMDGDYIVLKALVASPDGSNVLSETVQGKDPVAVGKEVFDLLSKKGAKDLIDQVKKELDQS